MTRFIDLRSDTVTLPTHAMREAICAAALGDDGYGEDPTVNSLQELSAARLGKEAALFMPSGTMANLVALLTHCQRGDEVLLGHQAHIVLWEGAGAATLGGLQIRTVPNLPNGGLAPADVWSTIRRATYPPRTALLCLENTHNRCGGTVLGLAETETLARLAHAAGIPVHLDGSRLFNAATALGVNVSQLAVDVDSVMFCFSKGLGAPLGSVLCGSSDFIARAHGWRMAVGGQMRQAGIAAAAAMVALETMVERLAEDHETARRLAAGLAQMPELQIEPSAVETNIVMFSFRTNEIAPERFVAQLKTVGVGLACIDDGLLRAVTHYGITLQDVDVALARIREVILDLCPMPGP